MMPKDNLTKTIIQKFVDFLSTVEQLRAELEDVMRFVRRSAVTAFAGVDLSANQSAAYEAKGSHISKCGVSELRRTLFLVTDCLLKNKPQDNPVTSLWAESGPMGNRIWSI